MKQMKTYTKSDFHNPEQLTRQQVGTEYRLLLPEEWKEYRANKGIQCIFSDEKWAPCWGGSSIVTYRVPLATPLPDGTVLSSNECCFSETIARPRIYCAGPMSNHPDDFNFPAFFKASEELEKQGYEAVNPAQLDIDAGYTLEKLKQLSPAEHQEFLKDAVKRDLAALQTCQAIAMLPGWENSKGAKAELAVAHWLGLDEVYLAKYGIDSQEFTVISKEQYGLDCKRKDFVSDKCDEWWPDEVHLDGAKASLGPCNADEGAVGEDGEEGELGPVDTGYSDHIKQPDADGWIPHVPGDPMPCDGTSIVEVRFKCGKKHKSMVAADEFDWEWEGKNFSIVAWRPAQPKQPYNSDERAEWNNDCGKLDMGDYSSIATAQYATGGLFVKKDIRGHLISSDYAPDDPKGAAGAKKAPMWLLPASAMRETAWVHKHGADKYGPFNWREGSVCSSTYISAIMRHLDLWRDGEDNDAESGRSHLASIAASCNILMDAMQCGTLRDDRNKLK